MEDPLAQIEFTTDRLCVAPWHDRAAAVGLELVDVVAELLTERTTNALPTGWQGDFDARRAAAWIVERDAESPTVLATDRSTGRPIALSILAVVPSDRGSLDLRIGYVVAEWAWGQGIASELLEGLVRWALADGGIAALTGGVELGNAASIRVLEKSGFHIIEQDEASATYRLDLRSGR